MNRQRKFLIAGIVTATAIAASIGFLVTRPGDEPAVDPTGLHKGSYVLKSDPGEIFSRAFWRRPAAGDKILHAERREWTESAADGPAHWQWFLNVEASPELLAWLRDKNPFSLRPADKVNTEAPPAWWPKDLSGWEIRNGGPGGSFTILFSRNSSRLCATDSGAGFTPAAPAADR